MNQKGFIHALVVPLLLVGIVAGAYLVQQKTNLLSKASSSKNYSCDQIKKIIQTTTGKSCGAKPYDVRADLNKDQTINSADSSMLSAVISASNPENSCSLILNNTENICNWAKSCSILYGKIFNSIGTNCSQQTNQFRKYDPIADLNKDGSVSSVDMSIFAALSKTDGNVCQEYLNNTSDSCVVGLKSSFFKNDSTAKSIIGGNNYTLSDNKYYSIMPGATQGVINTLSFEFKLMNAFRQLGYTHLTPTYPPDDMVVSVVGFHRYQRKHNLPISNVVNAQILASIDNELSQQEVADLSLVSSYEPTPKFIIAPVNEPPKEHLAALFKQFFTTPPYRSGTTPISINDLRHSLLRGLGANLGKMMDPTGTKVLSSSEMLTVVDNQEDYRYCPDVYYSKYNTLGNTKGLCGQPSDEIDYFSAFSEDYHYMYLVAHEYGHEIGKNFLNNNGVQTNNTAFGQISFDMTQLNVSGFFSSVLLRTSNNDGEFVSSYSKNNNAEDFAESFVMYIQNGVIFRSMAAKNQYLQQKYNFLKTNIFGGREFNTGFQVEYDWLVAHFGPALTYTTEDYRYKNPDFVWDYQYSTL